MRFIVDASVLSEPTKPAPDESVVRWLRLHERDLVVDPIVLGEIRFGILLLARSKRRARLEAWFESGVRRLQCIPWEAETGLRWAALLARLRAAGKSMPVKDSLIAASALAHGLPIATRNAKDFASAGVDIVNPLV